MEQKYTREEWLKLVDKVITLPEKLMIEKAFNAGHVEKVDSTTCPGFDRWVKLMEERVKGAAKVLASHHGEGPRSEDIAEIIMAYAASAYHTAVDDCIGSDDDEI